MYKNRFRALIAVAWILGSAAGAFAAQPGQLVALPVRVPDVVSRSNDLGHSDPNRVLQIAVSMPYNDPAGMTAFVDSVSDPNSPNYRQFMTPEEIGARFGLSEQQVQSVVDHLKAAGFNISLVGKNRLSILANGTVAQAEAAFNTSIHEFQAINADEPGNTRYFSHTTELTLPAPIAPLVIDVAGLENFTKPQHRALTPTQTRTLYNVAPMYNAGTQGQGRVVAISNFDGFRLTNVPLYYSHFSLPTPAGGVGTNVTVVTISGGAGGGTAQGEGDLDIQMPLGMAPLCSLRVYDGGGSNLIGVLTQESSDNAADVISESYGWNLPGSTAISAHNLHVSMSGQGITYMAASGDSGTTLEPYSYPDYEPEVLQVGGTVATVNGSGNRTSEVAWSSGGGGWSTNSASFNTLPSWQHGTNVPTSINKRLVPDVALHSGGSGAYQFYYNGGLVTNGTVGTSFASPVFAGALAASEQQIIALGGLPADGSGHRRFGRIQNIFYSQNGRSDVWFDVVSGSNGTLPNGSASNAGTAWDFCTGWGAINFNAFVTTQSSCLSPPVISPSSLPIAGVGAFYSQSLSSTGGTSPYTYTLNSGTLPPPLTLTSAGVISGTPTTTGTYSFSVKSTDSASCFGTKNYSIGVYQASCSLAPPTETDQVGTSQSVTVSVLVAGSPAAGATVNFNVTAGPNIGASGSSATDGNGQAVFTYTGSGGPGTDTIAASGLGFGVAPFNCTANKTWVDIECDLTPHTATNPVGTSHTVTCTVTQNGVPVGAGVPVNFNVTAGPNTGATGGSSTNALGQATFNYSDTGGPGVDTITSSGTVSGIPFSCSATKTWVDAVACDLTPHTALNPTGTSHLVTVTVTDNGSPVGAGTPVNFSVISGPNTGANGSSNTDVNGQTTFSYLGTGGPGTDTIDASGTFAGNPFDCTATKQWYDATCSALGDLNNDGIINGLDIAPFIDCLLNGSSLGNNCNCGDFDGSGIVDLGDVTPFANALIN